MKNTAWTPASQAATVGRLRAAGIRWLSRFYFFACSLQQRQRQGVKAQKETKQGKRKNSQSHILPLRQLVCSLGDVPKRGLSFPACIICFHPKEEFLLKKKTITAASVNHGIRLVSCSPRRVKILKVQVNLVSNMIKRSCPPNIYFLLQVSCEEKC